LKTSIIVKSCAAVALLSAVTAQAAVIDFDETSVGQLTHANLPFPLSLANVYHGQGYTEDGFQLSSSLGSTFLHTLFVPDQNNVIYRPAADSYAMAASVSATTTLTAQDHSAFSITSIDLVKLLASNVALNGSVTFYGTKADATPGVSQTFNYNGNWTTFQFDASFNNLSALTWQQGGLFGAKYEFDNINVSAVPEAGTWAMLMAGLGVLGLARRRRQQEKFS
jgi:MYXO-CTERM domain-containing protein